METNNQIKENICLIPDEFFFIDEIAIPSEIEVKEIKSFAFLQLESITPFPLEQILWGYLYQEDKRKLILFAALKDRLTENNFSELENYYWVLPEFCYTHKDLTNEELWNADIRPEEYKKKEQRDRKLLKIINHSFKLSSILIGLLLFIEVGLTLGKSINDTKQEKIQSQYLAVKEIEDQHNLIQKLEQISKNKLEPVKILEQANQIRLDSKISITYDTVDLNNENTITIKGTAGSINQLNSYIDLLKKSGVFGIYEDPKSSTKSGKTNFTIKLNYKS